MLKFNLQKIQEMPNWYLLSCPETGLEIKFEKHKFNDTQQVAISDEILKSFSTDEIAKLMREAGDWIFSHAYSIAFPTPKFEFRLIDIAGKEQRVLMRNAYPKFTIAIHDECTDLQLYNALKSASEFVKKYKNIKS